MAKKISSWKQKKTFRLLAPESFNSQLLGTTLALDPKNIIGRIIQVSMKELTDDRSKQHHNISFEVFDVEGDAAKTRFKKFIIAGSYLKSKVRKGMTKIDYVGDASFKEDTARIKVMIAAGSGVSSQQRKAVRAVVAKTIKNHEESTIEDFVQMTVFGKLGTEIFHGIKNICHVHRVEVQEIKRV